MSLNTFQSRILKFEILTRSMNIPEWKREITPDNIRWLYKNLWEKNSGHKNYKEALKMIDAWYNQLQTNGTLA